MDNKLKHAGISWDEWIRLFDIHDEHVLEMSDIIYEQEKELEALREQNQELITLLGSLDIEGILKELTYEDSVSYTISELENFQARRTL